MTALPLDALAASLPPTAAGFVPLRPCDVLAREAYERIRPRYLRLMTELRRHRRMRLAPDVGLLFESRETVLLQIHEVLRLEGHTPAHVERELQQYDCLVPRPGELRATAMIDGGTAARGRALAAALRRPGAITLAIDGIVCGSTPAVAHDDDDPVKYLRFRPAPGFGDALRHRTPQLAIAARLCDRTLVTYASAELCAQLRADLGAPAPRPLLHALAACPWRLEPAPLRTAWPT